MFCHPREDYTAKGYRFYVDFNFGWGDVNLYMMRQLGPHKEVGEVIWKPAEDGEIPHSTVHMDADSMQEMFDALYDFGFRPRGTVRPDALVEAKDGHLEDLRQVCKKLLEKI